MDVDAIVIGAGIAGLLAARALGDAHLNVLVLEKSRGLGGRAATRRFDTPQGPIAADHGAQYFTARDPRFQRAVEALIAAGVAEVWTDHLATLTGDGIEPGAPSHPRYAPTTGMNTLGKHFAAGLQVSRDATVTSVATHEGGYRVAGADFTHTARTVLITAPVPQGLALLQGAMAVPEPLRSVAYHPCWTVMIHAPHATPPVWRGLRAPQHDAISWIAHDGSKRSERSGTTLVIQASSAWSARHMDDPADVVTRALVEAATDLTDLDTRDALTATHRWRYAQVAQAHPERYAMIRPGLAFAGDAFGGADAGRIESAFLSGLSAAAALLESR